jgi:hypothetical protein
VLGGECRNPISSFSFHFSLFDASLMEIAIWFVQIETALSKSRYLLRVEQSTRSEAGNMASGFPMLGIVNIDLRPIR